MRTYSIQRLKELFPAIWMQNDNFYYMHLKDHSAEIMYTTSPASHPGAFGGSNFVCIAFCSQKGETIRIATNSIRVVKDFYKKYFKLEKFK